MKPTTPPGSRVAHNHSPVPIILVVLTCLLICLPLQSGAVIVSTSASTMNPQTSMSQGASRLNPNIGFYQCDSLHPKCPMGLADYGVNGKKLYRYNSTEFVSWANFTSLVIENGTGAMTVQQNLVDYGVAQHGKIGVYWAQNVPEIRETGPDSFRIKFIDNIWNLSFADSPPMTGVNGNLEGDCVKSGGAPYLWFCVANPRVVLTLPFEIQMITTTGTLASGKYSGDSYVEFTAAAYRNGVLAKELTYDEVAFNSTVAGNPRFTVGRANPGGIFNDAETVLCGPGGGASVSIPSISAALSIWYLYRSSLVPVPHAWSAGSDTAETVSGVHVSGSPYTARASEGTDNNAQLW